GVYGIKVETIIMKDSLLSLKIPKLYMEYKGRYLSQDKIKGQFKQNGILIPLVLERSTSTDLTKTQVLRPQTPVKPYPYYNEEVVFDNTEANIHLAGTLSLPHKEGGCPAVILISGSGAQNRDEEVFGHKPFEVIADYLTRNGIAVLRYDDRGVGQSTGQFEGATSFDFASDVKAALKYLKSRKEINAKQIGLIGHSEGGLIAPLVAVDYKEVCFLVLLAGPGLPGGDILLQQQALIGHEQGMSDSLIAQNKKWHTIIFDHIKNTKDPKVLEQVIIALVHEYANTQMPLDSMDAQQVEDILNRQIRNILNPWMLNFIKYDPSVVLQKIKCPILALNGEKDLQIAPKENLAAIKKALKKAKNKNVTIQELPNLNHLFQECSSGNPAKYREIEQTFSPKALQIISDWIQKQIK
ncbi:MAG: alpha/beta fold hydrolase, partial [Bacteroidales bacterium]